MTEFEIKHGLSQDEPGPLEPLEPVELAKGVPAARTVAGWLPIEIAPKDGTPVLLFARLVGVNIATNSPYAPTIHVGAYRTDLRIWTGSAYRNQLEIELEPTHWMPRPAFPDCGAPASPVSTEINPDECDSEVYKRGTSVGLFAIPKEDANAICAGIAAATGARVDWHYIAGRVHIKALPAPAPAAGDARPQALPPKMPKHESDGGEYPSNDSYLEGYAEGWNDAIDAAIAAQRQGDA